MQRKDYSEKKAQQIDDEVAEMLNARYREARDIMVEQRDKLDRIAESLLERETLETTDLELLMRGDDLPPMRPAASESEASGCCGMAPNSVVSANGLVPRARMAVSAGNRDVMVVLLSWPSNIGPAWAAKQG